MTSAATGGSVRATAAATGGGSGTATAVNHMPPYVVVYMWLRTA